MTLRCYERPSLVSIVMVADRSTVPPGLRCAVMIWMAIVMAIAAWALWLGFWPVTLFVMAMPLALATALGAHRGRRPSRECLTLDRGELHHDVITAVGVNRCSMVRPLCCLPISHGGGDLLLVDRNASRVVGSCLRDSERTELAKLLLLYGVRCRSVVR